MPTTSLANQTVLSDFHPNGVVKNGEKLFKYTDYDSLGNAAIAGEVYVLRLPNSRFALTVQQTITSTSPLIQFRGVDTFLSPLAIKVGVIGVSDGVVKSIVEQIKPMTSAELAAYGTPENTAPPYNSTFTDTSLECYTVGSQMGYVRDKNAVVPAPPAQKDLTASTPDTKTEKGLTYWLIRGGIAVVVVVGGVWAYNKFVKSKPSVRSGGRAVARS